MALPAVTKTSLLIIGKTLLKNKLIDINPFNKDEMKRDEPKLKEIKYLFIILSNIDLNQKNNIGRII